MENNEIAKQVEQTQGYVNTMFYISMSLKSRKLNKVLDNLQEFKKVFPEITSEDWGTHSDKKELPDLLIKYGYDGWLVEIGVVEWDRFKHLKNKVKRRKFIYCHSFKEIIPQMLEFSKDVVEEDIMQFDIQNRQENENK